jgi:Protein of unknown function (DUF2934)
MNDRRELERKLEQTKRLFMLAGDFTTRQRLLELQDELVDALEKFPHRRERIAEERVRELRTTYGSSMALKSSGSAPNASWSKARATIHSRSLQAEEGDWMSGPSHHEIECRAYRLWEQAGQPQGRDKEFYVEAERQLKEEQFGPQPGSRANC